ncbi:hypothetical protein HK102_002036 [Quaeritorhiza haematococci]|nr:hypothetical protein HK102_002036 [Quaeritorhiza haematococci]
MGQDFSYIKDDTLRTELKMTHTIALASIIVSVVLICFAISPWLLFLMWCPQVVFSTIIYLKSKKYRTFDQKLNITQLVLASIILALTAISAILTTVSYAQFYNNYYSFYYNGALYTSGYIFGGLIVPIATFPFIFVFSFQCSHLWQRCLELGGKYVEGGSAAVVAAIAGPGAVSDPQMYSKAFGVPAQAFHNAESQQNQPTYFVLSSQQVQIRENGNIHVQLPPSRLAITANVIGYTAGNASPRHPFGSDAT